MCIRDRICPDPRGHLQATGRDARGRKQYRYHPAWASQRDADKYQSLSAFGAQLPRIRRQVGRDMQAPGLPRAKVVAVVVRLLEDTLIRIGAREYARTKDVYKRQVQDARPSRRARAQQLFYLLDSAEDSFIALVAAADLLESNAPRWLGRAAGANLSHAFHRYASVANAIASTSDVSDPRQADCLRERLAHFGAGLHELRGAAMAYAPDLATMVPVLDRLQQTAQAIMQALFDQDGAPVAPALAARADSPVRQAWRSLRQNLRFESDAFRHALRVGIGATIAVALSKTFAVNHGYWMSLTLVFILQPYFATTWQLSLIHI